MLPKSLPPLDKLQQLFIYEPDTGLLFWRVQYTNRVRPGMRAGKRHPLSGYMNVTIDKKTYPVHRVGWALHYKMDPPLYIDHRDTQRANNRIANLRRATKAQNSGNSRRSQHNTTGFKGVHFTKARKLFVANIRIDDRLKFLGYYKTAEAAHAAYCKAGRAAWGAYFNPG